MAVLNCIVSSLLSDLVIKSLKNNNVNNTVDFFQEDIERLVNITKLTYKEIINIRNSIIENYGPSLSNGIVDYKRCISVSSKVPTEIIRWLDQILRGGLKSGKITEICGLPGSGKTQLALSIASNISSIHKLNIIYIDTKGDFSGKRVHEILLHKCTSENDVGTSLERIKVIRIWDMHELINFLHDLRHNETKMKCVRIIMIDSLPALMLQHQGEKSKESLGLLNHFVNIARALGNLYQVSFLIINLMTRWMEMLPNELQDNELWANSIENKKPALGKYWQHIPYVRLNIQRKTNSQDVELTVKSQFSHDKKIDLNLDSSGIIQLNT